MGTAGKMPVTIETLIQRIDTMMRELQDMRRLIMVQTVPPEEDLVDQLCGALAVSQDDYDPYLEWEQLASCSDH